MHPSKGPKKGALKRHQVAGPQSEAQQKKARFDDEVSSGMIGDGIEDEDGDDEDAEQVRDRKDYIVADQYSESENEDDEDMFKAGADPDQSSGHRVPQGGLATLSGLQNEDDSDEEPAQEAQLDDILEGQEFSKKDDLLSDDDEEEREMGYKVDRFNMKSDMEDGRFMKDGTFIRNARDRGDINDTWIDGTSKGAMRAARIAHERREKERAAQETGATLETKDQKAEYLQQAVELLRKGETIMQAIQRLGKDRTKAEKGDTRPSHDGADVSGFTVSINQLTDIASRLMDLGVPDIYDDEREHLVLALRQTGKVSSDWRPADSAVKDDKPQDAFMQSESEETVQTDGSEQYFYKMSRSFIRSQPLQTRPNEIIVQGPFARDQMVQWYTAGYFGASGENIEVKSQEDDWSTWTHYFG